MLPVTLILALIVGHLIQTHSCLQPRSNYEEAKHARDLVEGSEAILKTAKFIIKLVHDLVVEAERVFETNKVDDKWDEKYVQLCNLEHRTSDYLTSHHTRPETIKRLYERATKARSTLGKALGRETCSVKLRNPSKILAARFKMDARCEEEVRAILWCQALDDAESLLKYSQDFRHLLGKWCNKKRKFTEDKVSVKKVYKPFKCDEQKIAVISEEIKEEAKILIELLDLQMSCKSASLAKKTILSRLIDQQNFLKQLKMVYKKDFETEIEPQRKEYKRLALKLVDYEVTKLELNEELIKYNKFNLLHPSTWLG